MTVIKAGYRITVTSWENDGGNYKTITKDGFDEGETKLIVDLMKLLDSENRNPECFGNMYDPSDAELEKFEEALQKLFNKHNIDYMDDTDHEYADESPATDYAMEVYIDKFTGCGEFFTRVVESIKVEYIPQDIHIEDVSDKFGV